jgi:hypothetical protein
MNIEAHHGHEKHGVGGVYMDQVLGGYTWLDIHPVVMYLLSRDC